MIKLTCLNCSRRYQVRDDLAGRKVKCKCGLPIEVSLPPVKAEIVIRPSRISSSPKYQIPKFRIPREMSTIGSAIAGGLMLTALVVGVLAKVNRKHDAPLPAPTISTPVTSPSTETKLTELTFGMVSQDVAETPDLYGVKREDIIRTALAFNGNSRITLLTDGTGTLSSNHTQTIALTWSISDVRGRKSIFLKKGNEIQVYQEAPGNVFICEEAKVGLIPLSE